MAMIANGGFASLTKVTINSDSISMIRDIPDVVAPVKAAETTEDAEGDEDEGEQPILGHVSMATDLVRHVNNCHISSGLERSSRDRTLGYRQVTYCIYVCYHSCRS